jgi:hypothetical protein
VTVSTINIGANNVEYSWPARTRQDRTAVIFTNVSCPAHGDSIPKWQLGHRCVEKGRSTTFWSPATTTTSARLTWMYGQVIVE